MKRDKDLNDPPARSRAALSLRRWHRPFLFALAWIFLALGIVGLFVPLLPGTLCLIVAGACFTRSSPRFESWLLEHPRFGPPVREWRSTGAIPRTAKVFACVSLVVSWLIILASGVPAFLKMVCFGFFLTVAIYVVSRPER